MSTLASCRLRLELSQITLEQACSSIERSSPEFRKDLVSLPLYRLPRGACKCLMKSTLKTTKVGTKKVGTKKTSDSNHQPVREVDPPNFVSCSLSRSLKRFFCPIA